MVPGAMHISRFMTISYKNKEKQNKKYEVANL